MKKELFYDLVYVGEKVFETFSMSNNTTTKSSLHSVLADLKKLIEAIQKNRECLLKCETTTFDINIVDLNEAIHHYINTILGVTMEDGTLVASILWKPLLGAKLAIFQIDHTSYVWEKYEHELKIYDLDFENTTPQSHFKVYSIGNKDEINQLDIGIDNSLIALSRLYGKIEIFCKKGESVSRILFFSGAGLSADSGLGTFRDSGGLWDKYDIDIVCNITTWKKNYDVVHEFYSMRRNEYEKAEPNEMHKVIATLQQSYGSKRVQVITQNVDTLLEKAGCIDVMHVHGQINKVHCIMCKKEIEVQGTFEPRECGCGCKKFKPSIVFFGEAAPMYEPMYKAFENLTKDDLVIIIGTDGSVVPIDAILGNKHTGVKAYRILCNLHTSKYINDNNYDLVYHQKASEVAQFIDDVCKNKLN